jgi:predicted NAD-dependent protein-ADP-ribosyltransferase YbiA (DUF1768 family)
MDRDAYGAWVQQRAQQLTTPQGGEGDDARHRERIGNAVPPPAAAAIASVMGRALLAAWSGVRVDLAKTAVWVQRLAIPMSVDLGEA